MGATVHFLSEMATSDVNRKTWVCVAFVLLLSSLTSSFTALPLETEG